MLRTDIKISPEIRFSNLSQALELIHSLKFKSVKSFFKHIEQKFQHIPEIINAIKDNPGRGSKFIIFKNRLIDMFINDFSLTLDENMINKIIEFSQVLTDSRNYYTHYNDSKRNLCVVKDNLINSIYILDYTVSCYILYELGFSIEYINEKNKYLIQNIVNSKMVDKIIENKR